MYDGVLSNVYRKHIIFFKWLCHLQLKRYIVWKDNINIKKIKKTWYEGIGLLSLHIYP